MSIVVNQIREQRNLRGMSLRSLARELGISASQMSKIETGKTKLTVSVALRIADILKVPASNFLSSSKPKATGRRTITRNNSAEVQSTQGMRLESLCADFKEDHNLYWKVTITAKSFEEVGGWRQHPGQEFIFVIRGKLQLLSEYYDPIILNEGESVLFDSEQPHAYVAPEGTVDVLMINSMV